jgi:protein-histidine N-methyltransferase
VGLLSGERADAESKLGCGTALPSLALFHWAIQPTEEGGNVAPLSLTMADYNPTVLQLVTLPNFVLTWALQNRERNPKVAAALANEGELEINMHVMEGFNSVLVDKHIKLSFVSGGWSRDLVWLLYQKKVTGIKTGPYDTLVLGAETIYSPFALDAFNETLFSILSREKKERGECVSEALVAAKRMYFGVGGSLDDFIDKAKANGATVETVREETEGVRRGVVKYVLATPTNA